MQMRVDFGEQFNRAKDAEEAIQLGLYENDVDQFIKKLYEDLFDCGVAGYREWLGDDNKPKFRNINPAYVVTNNCEWGNFRDLIHASEAVDISVIDLAALTDEQGGAVFTQDQINDIVANVAGRWNNPAMFSRTVDYLLWYDRMKAKVLDIEFYSYNDYNYEDWTDKRGNQRINPASYENRNTEKKKYLRKRIKVVY